MLSKNAPVTASATSRRNHLNITHRDMAGFVSKIRKLRGDLRNRKDILELMEETDLRLTEKLAKLKKENDNLKFAAYWHSHNTDAFEKFMREYNLSFEKPCDCKACYMSNRTYNMWRSDDPAANDTDEDQEKPCIFTPAFNTLLEIYGIRVANITDQDNFVETVNYKGKLVNAGLEYHLVNIGRDKFNYWQRVAYGPAIYSCKKTTCEALEKLSGLFNYHADRVPPPAPNVVAEMVGQPTEG